MITGVCGLCVRESDVRESGVCVSGICAWCV